jgi:hypothetical protein
MNCAKKPPKPHVWSRPIAVYEGVYGFKCKDCDAAIMAEASPTLDDLKTVGLPVDCNLAVLTVIHEEYMSWDEIPWDEENTGKYIW